MLTKITHIVLFVHNQEEALTFYKKLGFEIHTDAIFGDMRWLTINLHGAKDMELVLMLAETAEEKALVGKQGALKPFISFESTDCRKDYERLKDLGIKFTEEPTVHPWGIAVSFKDLYGNMLYIAQSNS